MEQEIYKPIDGCQGYYVSNLGNVKRENGDLVNQHYSNGYKVVCLKSYGAFKVHRLVAQAFIPNSENKPCIDHINTIKDDNRVENLRWCTHTENMNNPLTKELKAIIFRGEKNPNYGKHLSEETKQKISTSLTGIPTGRPSPMKGKHLSDETKAKQSAALKGKPKPKQSAAMKGENNPMYGKHWKLVDGHRIYY